MPHTQTHHISLFGSLICPTRCIPKNAQSISYLGSREPHLIIACAYEQDFRRYDKVITFVRRVTDFFTLEWFGGEPSMYTPQTGLGFLNPLNLCVGLVYCRRGH